MPPTAVPVVSRPSAPHARAPQARVRTGRAALLGTVIVAALGAGCASARTAAPEAGVAPVDSTAATTTTTTTTTAPTTAPTTRATPPAATPLAATPPAGLAAAAAAATPGEYTLARGDVVEVRFYYSPELNVQLPVRPDGKLALPLIGEVVAAGRTPAELVTDLTTRYRVPLREPIDIAVLLKETPGRRVYVGGEVTRPGIVHFPGGITALQAVMEAGGFTRDAVRRNVVVLRNQGTATPEILVVNLASDTAMKEADLVLRPDDVVFVPKTRIARANQAVDQYFRQLLPITLSMGLSYVLGDRVFR